MDAGRSGVMAAVAAFSLWGVLPLFWKTLGFLTPGGIVAQRTLWSLLLLLAMTLGLREWPALRGALRSPRLLAWHGLSGALLASNWLLYIWATLNDRIIEGALGYYLNPFFNLLFGVIWFGERHSTMRLWAIGLALAGVAIQIPAVGGFPWVAVTLAVTFSLYAVVRKVSPLESRAGLTLETCLMAPFALVWLMFAMPSASVAFGGGLGNGLLVAASGLATLLPLWFFGHAARNIRLATLGMLQFIGPSLQLVIGRAVYGEPLDPGRLVSFALIWLAIALYAADALRRPVNPLAGRACGG
jgi:chloramphenicol-sensitive protein RarD